MSNFHTHTYYSPRDAIMSPKQVALFQKKSGKNWFSITDHGSMAGHPEGFEVAEELGMNFFAGVEFYVRPSKRFDGKINIPLLSKKVRRSKLKSISDEERASLMKEIDDIQIPGYNTHYFHITAVAYNQKGLENLYNINNNGDFYYKTRVKKEDLLRYNEGIVLLSGCPAGEFMKMIELGYPELAKKWMLEFKEVYKDRLYFELMYHDGVYDPKPIDPIEIIIPSEIVEERGINKYKLLDYLKSINSIYEEINSINSLIIDILGRDSDGRIKAKCSISETPEDLAFRKAKAEKDIYIEGIKIARECGVKIIGSNDSHYAEPKDRENWLITRMAMIGNDKDFTGDYHLLSDNKIFEKVYEGYITEEELDEAENEIASRYEKYDIFRASWHSSKKDKEDFERLVWTGFKNKRLGTEYEEESLLQIPYELAVIQTKDFDKYFLKTRDIVKSAFEKGVLVGPGRGSAAGSECVYLLGITETDPLKYGLMFERFMNPGRDSFPDIDLDLSSTSCENFKPNKDYREMFFEDHEELATDEEIAEFWRRYSELRIRENDNRRKDILETAGIDNFENFIGFENIKE